VLSSIARQLLFKDISLAFGASELYIGFDDDDEDQEEMDNRHARQSAEILCHLITNPECARQVSSLTVAAPNDSEHILFSCFIGAPSLPDELELLLNIASSDAFDSPYSPYQFEGFPVCDG
jgi:hypothetical protein